MDVTTLAQEAEYAAGELRDAQFTRMVLIALTGFFLLVGFDQHMAVSVVFGFLSLCGFAYWQFHEVPKRRRLYEEARSRFWSALWANQVPHKYG